RDRNVTGVQTVCSSDLDVLNNLSKQELIHIIVNLALDDSTLENSLLFTYANGDSQLELKACQELIDAIVRKYTGRVGIIEYRDRSEERRVGKECRERGR